MDDKPDIHFIKASEIDVGTIVAFICERDRLRCYLAKDGIREPVWAKVIGVFEPEPRSWRPTAIKAGEVWLLCGFPHGETLVADLDADDKVVTDQRMRPNFFNPAIKRQMDTTRLAFVAPIGDFKPPWEL